MTPTTDSSHGETAKTGTAARAIDKPRRNNH